MKQTQRYRLAAIAAGAVNGLFGGGGGVPLAVLLTQWAGLGQKQALANCVAVILPLCAVSAAVLCLRGNPPLSEALPYLLGGLLGGLVGGRLFRSISGRWLRRMFALFLLYGAVRYLA